MTARSFSRYCRRCCRWDRPVRRPVFYRPAHAARPCFRDGELTALDIVIGGAAFTAVVLLALIVGA